MDIRPIHTEADYDAALVEVEPYFVNEPVPGTPEAGRFEILLALIINYEQKHWAIEPPDDPVEVIRTVMEDRGLTQTDLGRLLGSRSRASELLRGKRPLSMEQAQTLYREWHVPAEVLLASTAVKQGRRVARTSAARRTARKATPAARKRVVKAPARKRALKARSATLRKSARKPTIKRKRATKRASSKEMITGKQATRNRTVRRKPMEPAPQARRRG